METATWLERLLPARLLVDTATGWLLGTEPPREMRGRLVDAACLVPGTVVEQVLPGLERRGVPVSNLRFTCLYLVRDDDVAIEFDLASSRRLARFLASDEGAERVVVRAGKKLDGTFSLISVVRDDALHRAPGAREGSAPVLPPSGRGGARVRLRPVVATPSRMWQ